MGTWSLHFRLSERTLPRFGPQPISRHDLKLRMVQRSFQAGILAKDALDDEIRSMDAGCTMPAGYSARGQP